MSEKISDRQAVEYALKLAEYCKSIPQEDCDDGHCVIRDICSNWKEVHEWEEVLNALVTDEEPKYGEWIPCSERLPEEKEDPITMDYYEYPVTVVCKGTRTVKYYKFGEGHWFNGPAIMDEYVKAWMPLPEPWEEE